MSATSCFGFCWILSRQCTYNLLQRSVRDFFVLRVASLWLLIPCTNSRRRPTIPVASIGLKSVLGPNVGCNNLLAQTAEYSPPPRLGQHSDKKETYYSIQRNLGVLSCTSLLEVSKDLKTMLWFFMQSARSTVTVKVWVSYGACWWLCW